MYAPESRYSGEASWESSLALNVTAFETTRADVAASLYPDHYNNSYPNNGLLGCYCLFVASTAGPVAAEELEIKDPYTQDLTTPCVDFFDEYVFFFCATRFF